MVSNRGVSVAVCVVVGLGCIASVLSGHGRDDAAAVAMTIPPAAAADMAAAATPVTASAGAALARTVEVDTSLPTGAIAPGSALHSPNAAAYADAAKAGSSLIVTGAEAINYLAGNTLRREGPGLPLHFTYFASRGVMGEGDERVFTARRWDRERPELCEPGPDGATQCRSVSILLDGKYEFPGARLGTVTLAAAQGVGSETAVLVKGNAIHVPEHVPLLDSTVTAAADTRPGSEGAPASRGSGDAFDAMVGRPAAAVADGSGRDRTIVYYARDNRRLELQQIQAGDGKAVQVTVGHWRDAKASLCQSRVMGEAAQTCFKVERLSEGVLRLVPSGKAGEAQTLTALPESGAREVAQD